MTEIGKTTTVAAGTIKLRLVISAGVQCHLGVVLARHSVTGAAFVRRAVEMEFGIGEKSVTMVTRSMVTVATDGAKLSAAILVLGALVLKWIFATKVTVATGS